MCVSLSSASSKAFDQYGVLTNDLEQEMELKERAETLAMEVSLIIMFLFVLCVHVHVESSSDYYLIKGEGCI